MARMFVGHYGISFAAKGLDKRIPLWILFLAVQFLDVVWGVLVLTRVEKARIVPGITATLPLDLYYMPYSHSLVAAVVWFGIACVSYRMAFSSSQPRSLRAGFLVGLAVFSHWVMDLLVHRPDLPVFDDSLKMGLGLWNYPVVAFVLEGATVFAGIWIYLRSTRGTTWAGRYAALLYGVALLGVHYLALFLITPPGVTAAAGIFLSSYFLLAGAAFWVERQRA